MRDVTDGTFEAEVLTAEGPVVVDFWAPWCGPCRAIHPILERLEEEADGRIGFAKLNVDENLDVSTRYGVLSLPTVIVFEGGEPKETLVGARPRAHFERALAPWLSEPK